jgi:hypothetical protein
MSLSEIEAGERLCHETFNCVNGERQPATKCLAGLCMAWRWAESVPAMQVIEHAGDCPGEAVYAKTEFGEKFYVCKNCGSKSVWTEAPDKRRGYCGKAGKPEF